MNTIPSNKPVAKISGEERDLVRRAQRGEKEALGEIWEANVNKVRSVAFGMLHNSHDVDDAVSEISEKFVRKFLGFKGESKISTWLHITTRTTCINIINRRKTATRRIFVPLDAPIHDVRGKIREYEYPDHEMSVTDKVIKKDDCHDLKTAIGMLSPDHRMIIILSYFEELNDHEIASRCQIPEGLIRSRRFYAIQWLRKSLSYIRLQETLRRNRIRR